MKSDGGTQNREERPEVGDSRRYSAKVAFSARRNGKMVGTEFMASDRVRVLLVLILLPYVKRGPPLTSSSSLSSYSPAKAPFYPP